MSEEPKDVIVLGIIKSGTKSFDKIAKIGKIVPEELNQILEKLESRKLIAVQEKKGFFGKKIEITTTKKGEVELEHRIHELEGKWNHMAQLYKSGNKQQLQKYMEENKFSFKEMIFFGVLDMVMFSMMFSMIGIAMTNFIEPQDMPQDVDGDVGMNNELEDGGFDIDIGF